MSLYLLLSYMQSQEVDSGTRCAFRRVWGGVNSWINPRKEDEAEGGGELCCCAVGDLSPLQGKL